MRDNNSWCTTTNRSKATNQNRSRARTKYTIKCGSRPIDNNAGRHRSKRGRRKKTLDRSCNFLRSPNKQIDRNKEYSQSHGAEALTESRGGADVEKTRRWRTKT